MTLVLAGCGGGGSDDGGGDGGTIKVALGDIESVETLALFSRCANRNGGCILTPCICPVAPRSSMQ